jgi:hypothetical protein
MAFHAADTHRATSEGAARKGRLNERCGLEQRTNFSFFRLRNRQKLVRIRFENIRYLAMLSHPITHTRLIANCG